MADPQPVETLGLTKVYRDFWGRSKVHALVGLDLAIERGEIFGLLGPNGSGKSTTIKLLLGLIFPTAGKATVLGHAPGTPAVNQRIGYLPEESYLHRFLTGEETVDFYGRLFGLEPKVRQMRIEALLEMVGLTAVAGRPVGTYSKGMARRIGLAQALINDPELLILDEPTTGLDPIGTRQIKDLILKLAQRGKTILLCSHLLADVEDVCDRIAILYGGKVQAEGHVKDLLQQTDKRQIVTGAVSDATIERIRALLAAERAECEVTAPMERLEAFFIDTVVEAQRQARPTSGAVSTTRIGDFLEGGQVTENILDKLVSAAPVAGEKPAVSTKTERAAAVETAKPDKGLLDALTQSAPSPQTESVLPSRTIDRGKQPKQAETPPDDGAVKKDVLNALLGRSGDGKTTPAQPKQPKDGEGGNV